MICVDMETIDSMISQLEYLSIFKYLYDESYDISGIGFEVDDYSGFGDRARVLIHDAILDLLLGEFNKFVEVESPNPEYEGDLSALKIRIEGLSDFIIREDIAPFYNVMKNQLEMEYFFSEIDPTLDVKDDVLIYKCTDYGNDTIPYLDYEIVKSINEFKNLVIKEELKIEKCS